MIDMLTIVTTEIILQYIDLLNQHVAHLKFTQLYARYISIKKEKKKKKRQFKR